MKWSHPLRRNYFNCKWTILRLTLNRDQFIKHKYNQENLLRNIVLFCQWHTLLKTSGSERRREAIHIVMLCSGWWGVSDQHDAGHRGVLPVQTVLPHHGSGHHHDWSCWSGGKYYQVKYISLNSSGENSQRFKLQIFWW